MVAPPLLSGRLGKSPQPLWQAQVMRYKADRAMQPSQNEHKETVAGFGDEWSRFDQSGVRAEELERTFNEYFAVVPWNALPEGARGIDVGVKVS